MTENKRINKLLTWSCTQSLLAVFVLSWGSVVIALVLQHRFGMAPCAWCIVQRVIYLLLGSVALVGALLPVAWLRIVAALLSLFVALGGVAAALYQQLVASKSTSCGFSWADELMFDYGLDELAPWLFKASAPCNEANIPLLGVPFAVWSALLFVALAVICLRVLLRRSR